MSTSNNTSFKFSVNYDEEFKLNPLTYQDGLLFNINVHEMDFEDMVNYLKRKLRRQVHSLYYALPPNNTLQGMKAIKREYDISVMYDIAKVVGNLQIYVSDHPIDLSTTLLPNDGSLEEAFADIISEETKLKQQEALRHLHQMVQKKKYVNGGKMNINILRMKLAELKQYLFNIVDRKIHALYYDVPYNGFSSTVKLRNNYDMHVMFDISVALGKLEIYIDHVGVGFVIAKHICPNATLAKMMNDVLTDYTSDSEDGKKELTQTNYTVDQMVEWAEQEHFEKEEAKEVQCTCKARLEALLRSKK